MPRFKKLYDNSGINGSFGKPNGTYTSNHINEVAKTKVSLDISKSIGFNKKAQCCKCILSMNYLCYKLCMPVTAGEAYNFTVGLRICVES